MYTSLDMVVQSTHHPALTQPAQVPQWSSNFAPGIKTKLKKFSGEILKKIKLTGDN